MILITGLFSNFGPPSFADTQAYFQRLGLDCEIAKIDSEVLLLLFNYISLLIPIHTYTYIHIDINFYFQAAVINNAKKIKNCIKTLHNRSGKKVVILGHSKGGLDAAAALSIYWHKLEDKVAGLVLAQCPYAGNPIASDILRQGSFQRVNLKREVMELVMSGILKVYIYIHT